MGLERFGDPTLSHRLRASLPHLVPGDWLSAELIDLAMHFDAVQLVFDLQLLSFEFVNE